MSNTSVRVGGLLFLVGSVGIGIYTAIHKAVTCRLPEELPYAVWSLIALSILADIYFELNGAIHEGVRQIQDNLRDLERKMEQVKGDCETFNQKLDGISQINDKMRDLESKIDQVKGDCETLNWTLDTFKTEFDDSRSAGRED